MPAWLSITLGLIIGLITIGGALYWAFQPPKDEAKSILPSTRDPGLTYHETGPSVPHAYD